MLTVDNLRIVLTQFWVHVMAAWCVGTGVGYWLADRPRIVQLSGVWIACAVTFTACRAASGALQRKAPGHGR